MDEFKTIGVEPALGDDPARRPRNSAAPTYRRRVTAERAKTLQSAFVKATSDPEFVAEAKRRQLELNPIPW